MKRFRFEKFLIVLWILLLSLLLRLETLTADSSKYPQVVQPHLPKDLVPEFIYLDQLVDEIIRKKRPVIVDVRSREEYDQAHIKGSVSIPLGEIANRLGEMPRDRSVIFY